MSPQKAGHRVERPFRTDESAGVDRSPALSFPFSAFRNGELPMMGLPHPPTCVLRLSQPLDALLPPNPSGLVSSRLHSWGFDSSEIFPHKPPNTSRLVMPLLALSRRIRLQGFERLVSPYR